MLILGPGAFASGKHRFSSFGVGHAYSAKFSKTYVRISAWFMIRRGALDEPPLMLLVATIEEAMTVGAMTAGAAVLKIRGVAMSP